MSRKKKIRYLDFSIVAKINRSVVALTKDLHEYSEDDEEKLKIKLTGIKSEGSDEDFKEAVTRKAALLMFGIASGQHFHEGNKRTALVAGAAFLRMNGYEVDLEAPDLVAIIDKAGIGLATLNDVDETVKRLIRDV